MFQANVATRPSGEIPSESRAAAIGAFSLEKHVAFLLADGTLAASDGSSAGTGIVASGFDLSSHSAALRVGPGALVFQGKLVFAATVGGKAGLYVSDGTISGTAAWTVNEFDPRTSRTRQQFGRYEFRLREAAGAWRYAMKKTIVVNDLYPAIIEIFNV